MNDEITNRRIIEGASKKLPLPISLENVFRFRNEENPVFGETHPVSFGYVWFRKQRVVGMAIG